MVWLTISVRLLAPLGHQPFQLTPKENVSNFEKRFAERVSHQDGYLDGWGVLVNP